MLVYKEEGITMNQLLEEVKKDLSNKKIKYNKLAFTARLDPMALGYVPILIDEQCKTLEIAIKKNKKYNVKVIIGLQTDSDDVLGLLEKTYCNTSYKNILERKVLEIQNQTPQTIEQKYHYYSTKQLISRRKNDIHRYTHQVTLHDIHIVTDNKNEKEKENENENENENEKKIYTKNFIKHIISKINTIDKSKDFRQKEICNMWENLKIIKSPELEITEQEQEQKQKQKHQQQHQQQQQVPEYIDYIELELDVSSGFFIRQFIRDVSDELNIPLLCFQITRTEIY
jgi:tRNA U55 pseudouridine synthase TruB